MHRQRAAVIAEAREWLGTPYCHMGRVKGGAADCLTLLAEVYERAGVTPHIEIEHYPPDWYMHRDAERYVAGVLGAGCAEIAGPPDGPNPEPGDIVVFRFGRCFAHGAIVLAWPRLIVADQLVGRVTEYSAAGGRLLGRPRRFFRPPFEG